MHPNRKFHLSQNEMAEFVRAVGFATLVVATGDGLRAVHAPVLIEGERLLFHVGRGNGAHAALASGAGTLAVVNGPDAYISPDWYGTADRVPTWNYVAVELSGPVRALEADELLQMLDALSAEHEARLAPKPAWTRAKMSLGRFEGLLKAITGFEMTIADWRGTAKLDQDRPQAERGRVSTALQARGEEAMAAVMGASSGQPMSVSLGMRGSPSSGAQ